MSGWLTIYRTSLNGIQRQSKQIARLQEQASSGSRVLQASDDPTSATRILQLQSQTKMLKTYEENLDRVTLNLENISTSLDNVSESLIRAQELATQAASSTLSDSQRAGVAGEIDSLLEEVVSQANMKSTGSYLFSGHKTTSKPYKVTRSDGKIVDVTYQGGNENLAVPVAPGVEYNTLTVGDEVFRSQNRGDIEFLGATGAAAGAGTSNVTGDVYLTVSHDTTTYDAPDHGLAKGSSSDSGDTIVGEHKLTIDSSTNTIKLDSGEAVSFDPTDTNVKVTNAQGEIVYVDVSSWDGSDAEVTIDGGAKLSIDGGKTSVSVTDFDADVAVTDADGHVLHVDPSNISKGGTEPIRVPGTYDLFGTLINLRDLMTNEKNFSQDKQQELLQGAVDSIKEVASGVRSASTTFGAKLGAMDSLKNSVDNIRHTAETEADDIQSADVVEIATELTRLQTMYEMTLMTSSKLLSTSLLDYL